MRTSLVTAPDIEPVTVAEVRTQLRVDLTDEDTYIALCITTARQWCENYTQRKFITQTWRLYLDKFAVREITLPYGRLQSISSIQYYDTNNALQTLSSDEYEIDIYGDEGMVRPKDGYDWPATYPRLNAVIITFICGYGDDATDVPEGLRHAIKYTAGQLYENRESISSLPQAVQPLIYPYTIFNFYEASYG